MSAVRPGAPPLRYAGAVLASIACLLALYRVQLLSGGDRLPGDVVDVRIAIALQEHWRNVLRGLEAWNQPLYFYPTADTLGYNDGYLLFGVFYALGRAAGLDVFLANEAAGAVFRVIGFAAMAWFGRSVIRLPFGWAVLAAAVATLSNALFLQSPHIQLLSLALAPLFACLAWRTLTSSGGRQVVWSCLAALLVDAWLLTAFYPVWFTGLFGLLLACAGLALQPAGCWRVLRRLRPVRLLPALALLLAGGVPFAATYLPKASETGMHPLQSALSFTPSPLDLVHLGSGNILFGGLDRWITRALRPGFPDLSELTIGFSPVLLGLAVMGGVLAFTRGQPERGEARGWLQALAVTALLCVALSVRIGGSSLWWLVHEAVPGARAVRVVCRLMLLLVFPAALLAAFALAWLARAHRRLAAVLAGLLLAGELNAGGSFDLDRRVEGGFLAAMPPPPSGCQAFYLSAPRPIEGVSAPHEPINLGVDAMLLAELAHVPTLNGHASFSPLGYRMGFAEPASYAVAVRVSVAGQEPPQAICALDPRNGQWSLAAPSPAPVEYGRWTSLGSGDGATYVLGGWSADQAAGRWTEGHEAGLVMSVGPGGDVALSVAAEAFQGRSIPSPVDVLANGTLVAHWQPIVLQQTLTATIPRRLIAADGVLRIRFGITDPKRPADGRQPSRDMRQLGLFVERFRLDLAGAPAGG